MPELYEQFKEDPQFNALPLSRQARIYLNYFNDQIADDEFLSLPIERQRQIKTNYLHEQGVDLGPGTESPEQKLGIKEFIEPYKQIYQGIKEKRRIQSGIESIREGLLKGEKESKLKAGIVPKEIGATQIDVRKPYPIDQIELPEFLKRRPSGLYSEKDKASFLEKGINAISQLLNVPSPLAIEQGISGEARAQALVELMAKEKGIPLAQYRESPEFIEQMAQGFTDVASFGLLPALKSTIQGKTPIPATGIKGKFGSGIGSFLGLIFGPAKAFSKGTQLLLKRLPQVTANAPRMSRIIKQGLRESLSLAPVIAGTELGRSLQAKSFRDSAGIILEGLKSGAFTGAIFGSVRGLFPKEAQHRAYRIITGWLALNAQRIIENPNHEGPWNRPVEDVVFDTIMDTYFMWHGLPGKNQFTKLQNEIEDRTGLPPKIPALDILRDALKGKEGRYIRSGGKLFEETPPTKEVTPEKKPYELPSEPDDAPGFDDTMRDVLNLKDGDKIIMNPGTEIGITLTVKRGINKRSGKEQMTISDENGQYIKGPIYQGEVTNDLRDVAGGIFAGWMKVETPPTREMPEVKPSRVIESQKETLVGKTVTAKLGMQKVTGKILRKDKDRYIIEYQLKDGYFHKSPISEADIVDIKEAAARGEELPTPKEAPAITPQKPPTRAAATGTTIYRQGRHEGKWWTPSKEYAESFGKKTAKVQTSVIPENTKLIDEERLKELNPKYEDDLDKALSDLGYDGMIRLEEDMSGKSYPSYYFVKPPTRAAATEISGVTPQTPSGIEVRTPDGRIGILNQTPAKKFAWVRFPSKKKGVSGTLESFANNQLDIVTQPPAQPKAKVPEAPPKREAEGVKEPKVFIGDHVKFKTKGGIENTGDVSSIQDGQIYVIPDGAKNPIPIGEIISIEKPGKYRERDEYEAEAKKVPLRKVSTKREPKRLKRLYEGITPGTSKWKQVWQNHPELQDEMLRYKAHFKKVPLRKAQRPEDAQNFRALVNSLGKIASDDPNWKGEIRQYVPLGNKRSKAKGGVYMDELLAQVREIPEWATVIRTEQDVLDALQNNIEKPSVIEGKEVDIYEKELDNLIEERYGKFPKNSKEYADHRQEIEQELGSISDAKREIAKDLAREEGKVPETRISQENLVDEDGFDWKTGQQVTKPAEEPINLEWGKSKPHYLRSIPSRTKFAQFLRESKEIAWIDLPYTHKEPVYFHKNKLVRVSEESGYTSARTVHEVIPSEHGEFFHWKQTKDARQIAPQFGAEITKEPTKQFAKKKQWAEATGLRGMPKAEKEVIKQPAEEPLTSAEIAKATEEQLPIKASPSDIPFSLAMEAHRGTSFDPEKRASQRQQDYMAYLKSAYDELKRYAKTDEQKAILKEELEDYRLGLIGKYKAVLQADSRTMSAMITGPSKFPTERNRKRLETAMKRSEELTEWDRKARRKIKEKLVGPQVISSDMPDAIQQLQKKIDKAEKFQETMKTANKIVKNKKLSDEEKIAKLQEIEGISEQSAKKLLEPDYAGRVGFPSYELQNNNANIRRMKERIEELQTKRAQKTNEIPFEGGKVIDNVEENRLQIIFDEKPDAELRAKLKSKGFRWAPSSKAWQRKRSWNANYALQTILDVQVKPQKEIPTEPSRIEQLEGQIRDLESEAYNAAKKFGEPWSDKFKRAYEIQTRQREKAIQGLRQQIKDIREGEKSIFEQKPKEPETQDLFGNKEKLPITTDQIIKQGHKRYLDFDEERKIKAFEWAKEVEQQYPKQKAPKESEPPRLPKQLTINQTIDYINIAWPDYAKTKTGLRRQLEKAIQANEIKYLKTKSFNVPYQTPKAPDGVAFRPIKYDTFTRESVDEWIAKNIFSKKIGGEKILASEVPTKYEPIPPIPQRTKAEVAKRSMLITNIQNRLNVPIRTGKFRKNVFGKKRGGIYKERAKVIRLARANDLELAMHEVGHHIQTLLDLPKVMPEEVQKMAYKGATDVDKEGFAEFLRMYITQESEARSKAQAFYDQFETALKKNPDVQDVIVTARQGWNEWKAMPSAQKVGSFIVSGKRKTQKQLTFNQIYTYLVDENRPLQIIKRIAEEQLGRPLQPSEDPFILSWLIRGWPRKGEQYLKWGTFQINPEAPEAVEFTGKGLRQILQPIEKRGERPELDWYLFSKRAIADARIQKGFKGILSLEDFKQTIKELEPKYKNTADELYNYNDQLLTFLTKSGRIDQDTADRIRKANLFYAPLYRVMDADAPLRGLSRRKYANLFQPIKRLGSSSRFIWSPTENILYNTYTFMNIAERNRVGKALANLAEIEGMGKWIEKIPFPVKPVKMSFDEALRDLSKQVGIEQKDVVEFFENEGISEEMLETIVTTFRPNYRTGPNEAIFYRNGKPELYELAPDLYSAVQALDADSIGMFAKILGYPAKWLRAGATLSPEFISRNPARDQWTAFVYSKYGYKPGYDLVRGMFHILGKSKAYQTYNASGAAHAALVSLDREYLGKSLKELLGERTITNAIKHPLQGLQILSELTEEATRVSEFIRAMKKEGKDLNALLKAGQAARDVTLDFSRIGLKTKSMNAITAFFNAQVQGPDKMVRAFKDNPVRSFTKAFLGITLPSIMLHLAQKDDPYYQEIPTWRKILFWNIVTHKEDGSLNHIWSIPKPFELGIIFGSAPEMALDWLHEKDPEGFNEMLRTLATGLLPSVIWTFAVPAVEWFSNKSVFFDRPIVQRSKEDLAPVVQYGPHTSEAIKAVARLMDKVPGLRKLASPSKIQNLIFGYTGGLGRLTLEQIDNVLETLGAVDIPPQPTMTVSDIPGLRGFSQRFPSANTRSIETFYDRYIKSRSEWETAKEKKHVRGLNLKPEELKLVGLEKPDELISYEKTAKSLSMLRKMANAIYESKTIKPDEKREKLDQIYFAMINISRIELNKKALKKVVNQ